MARPTIAARRCGLILSLLLVAPASRAVTIELEYLGGDQQARAVGAGDLQTIMTAAAQQWEDAVRDPFTLKIQYGWAPIGGGVHFLLEQGGSPNRETAGLIQFNNDDIEGHFVWFLDQNPLSNASFADFTETSADLGGGAINVGRTYSSYSSSVSADVLACVMCSDLFTSALHEIGHSLGMSAANASYINESANGLIDIASPLPFSGTQLQLVPNFDVAAHFENSGILGGTEMSGRIGYGWRTLLTDADILAVAQLSGFRDLRLHTPIPPPISVQEPPMFLLLIVGLGMAFGARTTRRLMRAA